MKYLLLIFYTIFLIGCSTSSSKTTKELISTESYSAFQELNLSTQSQKTQ